MTDLVDPTQIERIVETTRDARYHYARADSTTETVYLLHSQECVDATPDLRECPFSSALDAGIVQDPWQWARWREVQDRPVLVVILHGWLVPGPLSPDCAAAKHKACSGDAWDDDEDAPTPCACAAEGCHGGAA